MDERCPMSMKDRGRRAMICEVEKGNIGTIIVKDDCFPFRDVISKYYARAVEISKGKTEIGIGTHGAMAGRLVIALFHAAIIV